METLNATEKQVIKSKTYSEIQEFKEPSILTGQKLFDEWFSSDFGMVVNSAILVSGGSGCGKSTLMINLMNWLKDYKTSMYSREMASKSIKAQTIRTGISHNNAFIADIKDCANFDEYMKELDLIKPKVVIIDSLQVIAKEDFGNMTEEKAQYYIIKTLREWIEKNDAILFLIGHGVKGDEGTYLGHSTILHMIDANIKMVFNKKEKYRTISWGDKNRKGPMGMLYFSLEPTGIVFYTEEQFKEKRSSEQNKIKKMSYEDFMRESITSFLSTIDKNHINYSKFKKEYISECKKLEKKFKDNMSFIYITEVMSLISHLLDKYSMDNK